MRKALIGISLGLGLLAALAHTGSVPAADTGHAQVFEHVHALAFDASGRVLWLGAHAGLFRSEDGGLTWTKVALPVEHAPDVMAVATHPADAAVVYVGTHEAGVLRTTDGGRTWSLANTGLAGLDVHGVAFDPNTPAKLHAAVRGPGEGIYRTTDGGQKWVRVDDGPQAEIKLVSSVNVPTGMGGIYLFAGTSAGLQRSADCF